jgi:hypothetical protein
VAGLYATGAGDAKLLVEFFLGLCSGVQQELARVLIEGQSFDFKGSASRVLLAGGLLRWLIID